MLDGPRTFRTGAPTVCRQAFTFAGIQYQPEQVFPHADLGVPATEVYGLWLASLVDCTTEVVEPTEPEIPGIATATASKLTRAERRALKRQG